MSQTNNTTSLVLTIHTLIGWMSPYGGLPSAISSAVIPVMSQTESIYGREGGHGKGRGGCMSLAIVHSRAFNSIIVAITLH